MKLLPLHQTEHDSTSIGSFLHIFLKYKAKISAKNILCSAHCSVSSTTEELFFAIIWVQHFALQLNIKIGFEAKP